MTDRYREVLEAQLAREVGMTADAKIVEARRIDRFLPGRAVELRLELSRGPIGRAWSSANAELARYFCGQMDFERASAHAAAVLAAPADQIDEHATMLAGVYAVSAQLKTDQKGDEALLVRSIAIGQRLGDRETLAHAHIVHSWILESRDDLDAAIACREQAVTLYEALGSRVFGPSAIIAVAELFARKGDLDRARAELLRAREWLARSANGGMLVRQACERVDLVARRLGIALPEAEQE